MKINSVFTLFSLLCAIIYSGNSAQAQSPLHVGDDLWDAYVINYKI